MARPDGTIVHAEVRIGDSTVMMGEPQGDQKSIPAILYVYVSDTDATYKRALQTGGTSIMEPANQFYGDRNGAVRSPTVKSKVGEPTARRVRLCRSERIKAVYERTEVLSADQRPRRPEGRRR